MRYISFPLSLSLLVYAVGCMEQMPLSESSDITIVSSDAIGTARAEASSRLKQGPGNYERWERLHESVKAALLEHGTVSWDPDPLPDFYFSGDWFHENSDGYSVCSSEPIKRDLLKKLPPVLASHHEDAILEMNGIEQPIEGLLIFATSKRVLVGWDGLDQNDCEKRLREIGLTLD